jgi:hypothetical protein
MPRAQGTLGSVGLRATVLLSALGTATILALLLLTQQWGAGQRDDGRPRFPYLLEDISDRYIYQQRGRWLPSQRRPYVDEHSEYPQLATWMFGVPYLFFESHVPVGRAQTTAEFNAHPEDSRRYFDLHHVVMAISYLGLLVVTAALLRELGHSPGWALLLLLPGTVYFAFNRFDAWPAALVGLALLLQLRGRRLGAAAVLGLGAMMKWYPILLLPLFLAHNLGRDVPPGAGGRARRAALPRAVLAPGLAAAAVIAAILGVTFASGGWEAVKYVYAAQGGRVHNPPSLAAAILEPWRWGLLPLSAHPSVYRVLFLLQVLPAALLALVPVRSPRALILGCLAVVLAFAQFGKVFSPQWICWVAPLAVLVAPASWVALVLVVVLQVLIYVQIPVLYFARMTDPAFAQLGAAGLEGATAFWVVSDARLLLLALFWAWCCWAFVRTVMRPEASAA